MIHFISSNLMVICLTLCGLVTPFPNMDYCLRQFCLMATSHYLKQCYLFSFDQAAPWMVQSVRLSVTPISLCSHHRIIIKFSEVITIDRGDVNAKAQGLRSKVKVTSQIKFFLSLGISRLELHLEFTDGYEMMHKGWSARPGDKPLSEPMMVSLLTHICVTRPQWVNKNHCVLFKI